MKAYHRSLERILDLARRTRPEPRDVTPPDEVRSFADRAIGRWRRVAEPPSAPSDPARLWERVGVWSLGAATALVVLAAVFHAPARAVNPFDPLGPGDTGEVLLFESLP
jgi:hypothetical protein